MPEPHLIIDRYIITEILKPLGVICGVLAVIFGAWSLSLYLGDALAGQLPTDTVLVLVGLKVLIALEVLIPISLYFSTVLTMGRLHSDAEMTALAAAGVSRNRILRTVAIAGVVLAAGVGCLSLFARPWAYTQSYLIKARAAASIDLARITPGTFFAGPRDRVIIFATGREKGHLVNVFAQRALHEPGHAGRVQVIHARTLLQKRAVSTGKPGKLVFLDGYAYNLDANGNKDRILAFHRLIVHQ